VVRASRDLWSCGYKLPYRVSGGPGALLTQSSTDRYESPARCEARALWMRSRGPGVRASPAQVVGHLAGSVRCLRVARRPGHASLRMGTRRGEQGLVQGRLAPDRLRGRRLGTSQIHVRRLGTCPASGSPRTIESRLEVVCEERSW
jgi:hypothetical protein